jgi:hypothetical protein
LDPVTLWPFVAQSFYVQSLLAYALEMLPASPHAVTFYKALPPRPGDEFITVGWSESAFDFGAATTFFVTVIYGNNDEDEQPQRLRRRTIRFSNRRASEEAFKRECEIARSEFPGRVDTTEKIYAFLTAA